MHANFIPSIERSVFAFGHQYLLIDSGVIPGDAC